MLGEDGWQHSTVLENVEGIGTITSPRFRARRRRILLRAQPTRSTSLYCSTALHQAMLRRIHVW